MSDDIFIKHGLGSFQQPYNARQPSNAQQPNIRAQQEPNIRNVQEPNIRAQQEPNIRNYQVPTTYNHRSPTTYNHRSPLTYQHRSPGITQQPYINQQPSTYNHRSPFTYRHPIIYQHPGTYDHRSPYIADARQPTIKSAQEPNIRGAQEPNIRDQQQPNIRSAQEPNIAVGREPNIRAQQEPNIRDRQTPVTYARQGQTPSTYNHRSPLTYNHRSPYIASATGTIMIPDAQVLDATLQAYELDVATGGDNAYASAALEVEIFYNQTFLDGRLIVLATSSSNGSPTSANTKVYWFNDDHDVTIGGYTVRYTMTNIRQDGGNDKTDGEFTVATIPSTATGTAVPTGGVTNALRLVYEVEAEADAGSDNDAYGHFDINLILEHASLPTYTYTAEWDIHASASAESEE